jgi:hypothetical protein
VTERTALNGKEMTCDEFQQQLPELFESGVDLESAPHLRTCENCAALVRDLQYIADQAKLLLPIKDPSPIVWSKIRTALDEEQDRQGSAAGKRP